jgi:phosphoribosylformimino-5-aminoimidazole carboxamide ribotide isomerase
MIAIPAIDLKGGKVVRLLQGNFNEEKIYADSPENIAKAFEEQGAARLHVVDLDGALRGEPANLSCIEKIIRAVKTPVQVGGGVRDLKIAQRYFEVGAQWVILGTKACLDGGFLKEALNEYREKIIVGIDAKNGQVATDGWTKFLPLKAEELARETRALGARTVIYTDISKDGALTGPNIAEIKRLSEIISLNWIASGGISSLKDLQSLVDLGLKNIVGVIIGKALYEKKFSLKEAVQTCS